MQYPPIHRRLIIFLLCALAVAFASFLSSARGYPVIYSPISMPTAMIYLFVGYVIEAPRMLVLATPMLIFMVFNYHLLVPRSSDRLPLQSIVFLILAAILSIGWHILGCKEAVGLHGLQFYLPMVVINIFIIGIFGKMCYRLRKKSNWMQSCLVSTGIFSWIFWSALPWFGELI